MNQLISGVIVSVVLATSGPVLADESRLTQNQYLFKGEKLARGCHYSLTMQTDGNLVLTDSRGRPFWASGTTGHGAYAVMQGDGNLVVYNWWNSPLWSSGTHRFAGASALLQGDRNFVIYDTSNVARWASGTHDSSGVGTFIHPCSWSAEKTSGWPGWNIPGGDYASWVMAADPATPQVCASSCVADLRCIAYTFVPAGMQNARPVCWLKNQFTFWQNSGGGLFSGTIEFTHHDGGNL